MAEEIVSVHSLRAPPSTLIMTANQSQAGVVPPRPARHWFQNGRLPDSPLTAAEVDSPTLRSCAPARDSSPPLPFPPQSPNTGSLASPPQTRKNKDPRSRKPRGGPARSGRPPPPSTTSASYWSVPPGLPPAAATDTTPLPGHTC